MKLFAVPLMIGLTSAGLAWAAPDLNNLDATSCDQYLAVKSTLGDTPLEGVTFTNGAEGTRHVTWINYEGGVVHYSTLAPGQSYAVNTYLTHPWLIIDDKGVCRVMYVVGEPGTSITIRD